MPPSQWLRYYTTHFDTVEINNSFYRLPERATFAEWRGQTPASFVFAVKASRFLTHMKRLRDPDEPLRRLLSRAAGLGNRLGPVLYQLPAHFHIDRDRLERFLDALPTGIQHVLEFRHASWYVDAVFDSLSRHGVALCLHDMDTAPISSPIVGPFVYVRFHGASGRYHGSYSQAALSSWAQRLAKEWRGGRDVYAYFNNDPDAEATRNATSLRAALNRFVVSRARAAV